MSKEKPWASFGTILFLLLLKAGKIAKILPLLKVAKPMLLVVSMSISAIAYTFFMGPWLAILFVALLLAHEMGHVVAMKMKGMETPTPVFIPFLGAAVFAPKFTDRHTEAFVGYGGPLLGTLCTIVVFGVWYVVPKDTTASSVLLVGSYLSAYLNLFNLLPISPLDGGRITQAVGLWFKYVGLVALAGLSVVWKEPVILYIWILVLYDLSIVPLTVRGVLIPLCWVSMATLMYKGYSSQPAGADIADCVVTFVLAGIAVKRAIEKTDDERDDRPGLAQSERTGWSLLYFGLALVLIGVIALQFPYLPTPKH